MDVTPEIKLKRYLHYASEDGVYSPGCRFHFKNYTPEKLTCLSELISEAKEQYVLDCIEKVHSEGTSPYPEAIIFVIAQCIKLKKSPLLRSGGYKLAEKICTSSESFFTLFKFTYEVNPKCGSGRACRTFVKNWYLKKKALELAEIVARMPKYKGWTHADILKIAHVKSNDKAKSAVLKYIVKGLTDAKVHFGSEKEAEEVLSYLSFISDFRKTTDPEKAARMIESYMLSIDHVNINLLKSKEVWAALLRLMPLPLLLNRLQWLSKKGMFRNSLTWNYDFIKSICDALNNPASITDSGIHPSRPFIELCTYKNAARDKIELAVKLGGKPNKQLPLLCPNIIEALGKVIRSSFKSVPSTGLSYAVAVDINEIMRSRKCGYCRYMKAAQAASLITLCLLKAESNVDVLVFTQESPRLRPVSIPIESTIEDTENLLHQVGPGIPVDIDGLFDWAIDQKKTVDMFIILSTYIKQTSLSNTEKQPLSNIPRVNSVVDNLKKYAEAMNMPNVRGVLCNLGAIAKHQAGKAAIPVVESSNFLTISGFDDKVCKIIEAFAKGAF